MPLFQVQSSHFFMFPSHLLYHPCNKLSCYFFFSNLGGLRFQARPFPPFLVLFYVYQGEEMLLKRAIFLFLSLSRITHNRQRWMMLSFQVQSSYFFMLLLFFAQFRRVEILGKTTFFSPFSRIFLPTKVRKRLLRNVQSFYFFPLLFSFSSNKQLITINDIIILGTIFSFHHVSLLFYL